MKGGRPFRLFLSGFLACGKTTVGRVLARDLRLPFMDLDQTLVEEEGMPIFEMMDARGESYFRRRERSLLERLRSSENLIVATGSGTPATHRAPSTTTISRRRRAYCRRTCGWKPFIASIWNACRITVRHAGFWSLRPGKPPMPWRCASA